MDRTVHLEIENDYKTQIKDLEENLTQIGEFEAKIKPAIVSKLFYAVINYIVSSILFIAAIIILIVVLFFYEEVIAFLKQTLTFGNEFLTYNETPAITPQSFLKLVLYIFATLSLIIAMLLRSIRKKNNVIIDIHIIASDFKIRTVKMLEITKDRLKSFTVHNADEKQKYSKRE